MDYQVIKNEDLFFLSDKAGDVSRKTFNQNGLYRKDTRFLKTYQLLINGKSAVVLHSDAENNFENNILLTNSDNDDFEQGKLFIKRKQLIVNNVLYDRIVIKNNHHKSLNFNLKFNIEADFKDIFEVRNYYKDHLNRNNFEESTEKNKLIYSYLGLDEIERTLEITADSENVEIANGEINFCLNLAKSQEKEIVLHLNTKISDEENDIDKEIYHDFGKAESKLRKEYSKWSENVLNISTDDDQFNKFINRSLIDLKVLSTDLGYGPVPVAGIPWYAVVFGRDSIITALQTMIFNPDFAKGTLKTLAKYQGEKIDIEKEEEPGKIFHELRTGELANIKKIPHTPYYGTVDATPLFIILAGEYYKWTQDIKFIQEIMPNLEAALNWIDNYGDKDNDLYVEFDSKTEDYTVNQGWKDSVDSSMYSNANIAEAPIALAEVQAYVYKAKLTMADFYEVFEDKNTANQLIKEAEELKERFNKDFWIKEKEIFALALDKDKNAVDSLTTNPAHGFYCDIISEDKAEKFINKIMADGLNSGRGLRTMSKEDMGYNPISYHNGSIWPHDNSLIIEGLQKYNYRDEANQLISDIFSASKDFEYYRLPELYCGFGKSEQEKTIAYPVACSPQAWAAGSAFMFLQSILGIKIDSAKNIIDFDVKLPKWLNKIKIENLKLNSENLSFTIKKKNGNINLLEEKNENKIKINLIN